MDTDEKLLYCDEVLDVEALQRSYQRKLKIHRIVRQIVQQGRTVMVLLQNRVDPLHTCLFKDPIEAEQIILSHLRMEHVATRSWT